MTLLDGKLDTMPVGNPAYSFGVAENGTPVLFDPYAGIKPISYYHAGGSDYSAAFSAAMQDDDNQLIIPPSADGVTISQPISFVQGLKKNVIVPPGATIKAAFGFAGDAMVRIDSNGSGAIHGCFIGGGGVLDGLGNVDIGIQAPDMHRSVIDLLHIFGVRKKGIEAGVNVVGGAGRHGNRISRVEVRRRNGSFPYDPENLTIGVHLGGGFHDSWVNSLEPVGFNVGFKNEGGSNDCTGVHPWTTHFYGPMKYGLWTTSSTVFANCYADTPTSLGDGSVGPVYGYFIDSFSVDLISPRAYLLAFDGSTPIARHNEAIGVYFNVTSANGCYCNIIGGGATSSDPSVKWAVDVDSSNWPRALNAMGIVGWRPGPDVVSAKAGESLISPLKTYGVAAVNSAGGGSTRQSGLSIGVESTIEALPSAANRGGTIRRVTNAAAGKGRFVVSDGTAWRYVSDDSLV